MNKTEAKQIGVLNIYGSKFAILRFDQKNNDLPAPQPESAILHGKGIERFFVAKQFFIEKVVEGILTGETILVSPHFISISGDFAIEWLPVTKIVTVLLPMEGEAIND